MLRFLPPFRPIFGPGNLFLTPTFPPHVSAPKSGQASNFLPLLHPFFAIVKNGFTESEILRQKHWMLVLDHKFRTSEWKRTETAACCCCYCWWAAASGPRWRRWRGQNFPAAHTRKAHVVEGRILSTVLYAYNIHSGDLDGGPTALRSKNLCISYQMNYLFFCLPHLV